MAQASAQTCMWHTFLELCGILASSNYRQVFDEYRADIDYNQVFEEYHADNVYIEVFEDAANVYNKVFEEDHAEAYRDSEM